MRCCLQDWWPPRPIPTQLAAPRQSHLHRLILALVVAHLLWLMEACARSINCCAHVATRRSGMPCVHALQCMTISRHLLLFSGTMASADLLSAGACQYLPSCAAMPWPVMQPVQSSSEGETQAHAAGNQNSCTGSMPVAVHRRGLWHSVATSGVKAGCMLHATRRSTTSNACQVSLCTMST